MGRKSLNKRKQKFSILLEGEYKNNTGLEELKNIKIVGSPAIVASVLLGTLKQICYEAKAPYTEILSNEIKREVRNNALSMINVLDKKPDVVEGDEIDGK